MIFIEKLLTQLVMPAGLIWLALIGLTVLAWRRGQRGLAGGLLVLLVGFTLVGNGHFSTALCYWLERDYRHIDPLEEGPFDAVIVLGGGTSSGPQERAQLGGSGDRVMIGARLYLTGRTRQLVTTGAVIPGLSASEVNPYEHTLRIWQDLQIPADQVLQLPGRNTREEMAALAELVEQHDWQRIGLVTSAWHMRRSLRLADNAGLRVEPLPADYRSQFGPWTPLSIIPDDGSLERSRAAIKELLAAVAGR